MTSFVMVMKGNPEELKRRMYLSSTIYWITLLLLTFYLATQLIFDFAKFLEISTFDDWVPVLLCFISVICIGLNKFQYGKISRILFLLSWIIAVTVLPVLMGGITPNSYLVHPILCIVTSLMIHLFFSWHDDRWIYLFFLTVSILFTSFSYYFLLHFDSSESYLKIPLEGLQFVTIYSMSWVFVNLTLMYVYRINWQAYIEVQHKNDIIAQLNKNLESKVEIRTRLLKEQNAKLVEYAFVNSHILRAPVSRILGLVYLLVKSDSTSKDKEIIDHLEESSKELDEVVRNLSITLREAREDKTLK